MKNTVINVESFLNELISLQDTSYKQRQEDEESSYAKFVPNYLMKLKKDIDELKQQANVREQRQAEMLARRAAYKEAL